MSEAAPHLIVLPGGGYAQHAAHEAEPIAEWLTGFGVSASVFRYPVMARHPAPGERAARRDPASTRGRCRTDRCDRVLGRWASRWSGGTHARSPQ